MEHTVRIHIGILLVLTFGCSRALFHPAAPPSCRERCRAIALDLYGPEARLAGSPDSLYILCRHQVKPTPQLPDPPLRFFIYCCRSHTIIYHDEIRNGDVRWLDAAHVRVDVHPGTIRDTNAPKAYIIDIRTKKTRPVSEKQEETVK